MNNDVNDIRPTSLSHIIGQKAVVEAVQVAVDACFQDQCRFPHTMLIGPSGQGKSTIAEVIGKEMAVGFTECLGQSLRKPAELNALLLQQTGTCNSSVCLRSASCIENEMRLG